MSPKRTSYVAAKPQNTKTAVFRVKSHFAGRKSAIKFLCVKIVRDKVIRHLLA